MTSSRSEAKGGRAVLAGCALVPLPAPTACGHGGTDGRNGGFRTAPLARGDRLVITTQGGVRAAGTG
ncbi:MULTISPECIES: hypothetical protein [unclassified Streptomyces]|uniref:hypothetical protein n=1 Tax=unclassified Streptomyces TaxID=2593676 RepID=UPI002E2DFAFC|nr:hypothetical protein [Streptomyces sp. NBC_01423]